jgi:hypothetical protein
MYVHTHTHTHTHARTHTHTVCAARYWAAKVVGRVEVGVLVEGSKTSGGVGAWGEER